MIVMFDLLKIIMIINSNSHYSNSNDSMCWGWSMPNYCLVTHSGHLSFFFLCMRGGWHPRMVPIKTTMLKPHYLVQSLYFWVLMLS